MTEYIKRKDALDAVLVVNERQRIKNIPTADVVEVVRCGECSAGRKSLGNFRCSCAHWSNEDGYTVYTGPNDFCSYGVRGKN